jgi:hypothetical protein
MKMKHQAVLVKKIFEDVLQQMKTSNILLVASSLAYTTILSLIPLLALSFSIFQAFGGLEKIDEMIVPFILKNLTAGSSEEVVATLREFISKTHSSTIGIWGFVGLIVTSMMMVSSIDGAIHQVWQLPMNRKIFSTHFRLLVSHHAWTSGNRCNSRNHSYFPIGCWLYHHDGSWLHWALQMGPQYARRVAFCRSSRCCCRLYLEYFTLGVRALHSESNHLQQNLWRPRRNSNFFTLDLHCMDHDLEWGCTVCGTPTEA